MFDRWRRNRLAAFASVIVAAIFALVAGGLPAHAADPTPEASSVTAEPAPTQSSNDPVPPAPPQPTEQSPTTAPGPAPVPTPSKPNPPRSVTAVGGDGDALVRWDTSEGANAGPVIYIAKAVPGDRTCETNQTSCLITGLTNGTEYEFSVRAKGEGGESSATNAANRVAAGTDPPSEPTGVSAVGGDGKLDIS